MTASLAHRGNLLLPDYVVIPRRAKFVGSILKQMSDQHVPGQPPHEPEAED